MINKHTILKTDMGEILIINWSKQKEKEKNTLIEEKTLLDEIQKYLKKNNIIFTGNKIIVKTKNIILSEIILKKEKMDT